MFKIREDIMALEVVSKKEQTEAANINITEADENSFIIPRIKAMPTEVMTRNGTIYSTESFIKSINHPETGHPSGIISFTKPYLKPIITNHDIKSQALGRIVYGEVRKVGKGADVLLYPAITDKEAIEKVRDGRYLTVSIGIETDHVWCTICNQDLTEGYCEHRLKKIYDGKICGWKVGNVWGEELSFVNSPSAVAYVEVPDTDKNYIQNKVGNISYFLFNLNNQEAYYKSSTRTLNVSENVNFDLLKEVLMAEKNKKDPVLPEKEDSLFTEENTEEKTEAEVLASTEEKIETSGTGSETLPEENTEVKTEVEPSKQEEKPEAGEQLDEVKWDRAYVNDLPNAAFAVVKKQVEDKARDRALPHHNKNVKSATENSSVDLPHLRNALARFEQVDWSMFGEAAKSKARVHLEAHAKALKVGDYAESAVPENVIDYKVVAETLEVEVKAISEKFTALEADHVQALDEIKELKDENMFLTAGLHKANVERLTDLKVALGLTTSEEWEAEFEKYLAMTTEEVINILGEYSEEYKKKSEQGATKPVVKPEKPAVKTEKEKVEESVELTEAQAKETVKKAIKGLIKGNKIK